MFWPLIADTNKYQGFCFPRYIFRIFPKGIILMFTAASRLNVLTLFLVRLLLQLFFFCFCFCSFHVSFCLSPFIFYYTVPNKHIILNCFPNWCWPYSGWGDGDGEGGKKALLQAFPRNFYKRRNLSPKTFWLLFLTTFL